MKRLTFALAAMLMLNLAAVSFGQSKPAQTAPAVGTTTASAPVTGKITGVLKTKDGGTPITGASIQATDIRSGMKLDMVKTDKDGKFEIPSLKAGNVTLALTGKDDKPVEWLMAPKSVKVSAGKTKDVTLEASKGCLIEVTVLDEDTGKPIRAWVNVGFPDPTDQIPVSAVYSNEKGIAIVRVPPGECQISANASDYSSPSGNPDQRTAEEGKTQQITIKLKADPLITGVVKDAYNKPVANAVLMGGIGSGNKTDAAGKFSFRCSRSAVTGGGNHFTIVRQAERKLVGRADIDNPDTELAITLGKGLTLKGVVTDTNDKPIKGARVTVYINMNNGGSINVNDDISTDDKGQYELPAMPKDMEFTVMVSAEGHGSGRTNEITVDEKSLVVTVDKISLPEAKLELSGIVQDENGKGIACANVNFGGRDQPSNTKPVKTDKDGKFTIKGLVEGEVSISASNPEGNRYGNASASAGDTDVVVTMQQSNSRQVNMAAADDEDDSDDSKPASKADTGF